MKTLRFKHHGHLPILSKKTPRSKALESVCLSRSYLPPIATKSPGGEGFVVNGPTEQFGRELTAEWLAEVSAEGIG
jgi:hypothetical protein